MVVVFMGPSCTGKSSVAELIREKTNIQIVTGKDYLRLASDEIEAWRIFLDRVKAAVPADPYSDKSLIYILDDAQKVNDLMKIDGVQCIKFYASLDAIKDRYEARMQGELPGIVIDMLNLQKSEWDGIRCKVLIDSTSTREVREMAQEVVSKIS